MSNEGMPAPGKPLPVPDELSAPFFEGAKQERLMIQKCGHCDTHQVPGRYVCDACFSDRLDWVPASGKGTVFSFVIMHQRYHPGFASETPYNIAIIELEEGPRLVTNLLNVANEAIYVGMPVRVTFEHVNKEIALPKFQPAADQA